MSGNLKTRYIRLLAAIILLSLCAGPVLAAEEPQINYRDLAKTDDGGYVLAGTLETVVGNRADNPLYRGDICLERKDPNGTIVWSRTFGGEKNDEVRRLIRVSDGGFLVIGQTESFGKGAWVIRTDADGRELWNKTFGKSRMDSFNAAVEMRGGGFALAGASDAFSSRGQGAWLVRIDAQGTELWNRTFGGEVLDVAQSVVEYPYGGIVIAGVMNTESGSLTDALLIRTDTAGNLVWKKTFGGSGSDEALSVVATRQGEIIFTGSTFTTGLKADDFWVVKTDAEGTEVWNRKFSQKGLERGMALVHAPDNGFFVIETVAADTWKIKLVNLDHEGNMVWEREYTGIEPDMNSCRYTLSLHPDGTTLLSGPGITQGTWLIETTVDGTETGRQTFGMMTEEISPTPQTTWRQPYVQSGWLVRTDATGAELWNTTFGDTRMQDPYSVRQTADGGYVIAGSAMNDGMHSDAWLTFFNDGGQKTGRVVVSSDGLAEIRSAQVLPDGGFILAGKRDASGWESAKMMLIRTDKTGSKLWEKDLTDLPIGGGEFVSRTSDGGYIVSGSFLSREHRSPDGVILKTNTVGSIAWNRTFGGSGQDHIPGAAETPDGGYIAVLATTEGDRVDTFTSLATLIRFDKEGTVVWSRPITESDPVDPRMILSTSDGGFLVAGYTINGDSLVGPWIAKTDGSGSVLWHHVYNFGTYALKGSEQAVEVPGGGYALIGDKGGDIWLIRLDKSGTELWNATYGGWSGESARSLRVTRDGGFVIAGTTTSYPVTDTAHSERVVPLFILFTTILAGSVIIMLRKEMKRRRG